MSIIRSISPYIYSTPWVSVGSTLTCTSYTLNLYIYSGQKVADEPASPTDTITKINTGALSSGNDEINISRILADYLETPTVTGTGVQLLDGNAQWWVKTEVVYTTTSVEAAQYEAYNLFGNGYTYGNEGSNIVAVPDDILLDGREFKVNREGIFLVGIQSLNNAVPATSVKSYPDLEINEAVLAPAVPLALLDSLESTQYAWVDLSGTTTDKTCVVNVSGVDIVLLIEDEYKYDPMDIVFLNKYGAMQSLTFFKEFVKDLNVTKQSYESDNGQPSTGAHQYRTLNVQGREGFKVQSGWVDETLNETFKQLLLSERVWEFDGTTYIPLNLKSSSLSYKTQKIDRLIQYEIEFEYSFNVINNI